MTAHQPNTDEPKQATCRWCGQPTPPDSRGNPRVFCSRGCELAWRSERYKGNKHSVGNHPVNVFRAGHEPWNKGIQGLRLSPGSEFKPGHEPTNLLPLGTVTTRTDKHEKPRAWIKVAEPNTWIPRAVFVWLSAGNTIPRGNVVHHEDRDTMNDSPSNLTLTSRASHINEHRSELQAAKKKG